jgi:hypothetical protein
MIQANVILVVTLIATPLKVMANVGAFPIVVSARRFRLKMV